MSADLERQLRSTLSFVRDAHTETFVEEMPAIKREVVDRTRRRVGLPLWQWVGGAATAAAVMVAVLVFVTSEDRATVIPTPSYTGGDIGGRFGPEVEASFELDAPPSGVAFGGGAVYVGNADGNVVLKLDPRTGGRVARGSVDHPVAMTAGEGAVWVVSSAGADSTLSKLTPTRLAVTSEIDLDAPVHVAAGGGAVWAASPGALSRIDARAVQVVETFPIDGARDVAVARDGSSVWLATARSVERLDPSTGATSMTIEFDREVAAIAVTETFLWVISTAQDGSFGELNAFDLTTGTKEASFPLAGGPFDMAYGRRSLWIGLAGAAEVIRVDVRAAEFEFRP